MLFILLPLLFISLSIYLFFNPKFSIYSRSHLNTNSKVIALTFDDGPNIDTTLIVLKILKENRIKATFFVVGKNVRSNPVILEIILKDGHLIANHSDNHSYMMFGRSKNILKDVENCSKSIKVVTGKQPHFYRPAFGLRSPWGANAVKKAGYFIVTWNNMTYDYWGLSPKKLKDVIIKKARPGGIIVLHDGHEGFSKSGLTNMTDSLSEIIKVLKSDGYSFVTLSDLFNTEGYKS